MHHERLLAGKYRVIGRYSADSRRSLWRAETMGSNRSVIVCPVSKAKARWYEPSVGVTQKHLSGIVEVIQSVGRDQLQLAKNEPVPDALAIAELANGQTLSQTMSAGPLPLHQAVQYAAKAAAALGALHQHRATHGAISDRCLVTDRDDGGAVPVLTQLIEPPRAVFASPERLKGAGTSRFDDVWALHVLFYALLTGRLPYRGSDAKAVLEAIRVNLPDKLATEGIKDKRLQRILDRGLRYAPEERTDSVFDLEQALLEWLAVHDREELTTPPPSEPPGAPMPATVPVPHYPMEYAQHGPDSANTTTDFAPPIIGAAILDVADVIPSETTQRLRVAGNDPVAFPPVAMPALVDELDCDPSDGPDEATIRMDAPSQRGAPIVEQLRALVPSERPPADECAAPAALPVLPPLPPPAPPPKRRKKKRLAFFLAGILGGAIAVGGAMAIGTFAYVGTGKGPGAPTGSVPRGSAAASDSTTRAVVKAMFPPPISARPALSVPPGVAAPTASDANTSPGSITQCIAGMFPAGTFDASQDLAFVCQQPDPRRGATTMRARVVSGSRGKPTPGAQEWSRLEWHQIPVWSVLRQACCPSPVPLSLPEPLRDCGSVGKTADEVGKAFVAKRPIEGPLTAFQKAADCAYKVRDPAFAFPVGAISGGQVAFAQFVERNTKP